MFLAVGMLSGCSSAFYLTSTDPGADDVYYNPNRTYTAASTQPEMNPINSNDPRISELQKKMNTSMSDAVADTDFNADTVSVEQQNENPYDAILADSYQDAQSRRDAARTDPSLNYSDLQTSLWYASAYDPAFYNVIIYGSHVWVEPKYMSTGWYKPMSSLSFYGDYGYPYSSNLYFGFGYSAFDYGFYPFGFGFGLSFYNPYYAWNDWGYGHYPYYNDYGNEGRNHRPYYYGMRNSNFGSAVSPNVLRRSNSTSLRRSTTPNSGNSYARRPATTTGNVNNSQSYSRRPANTSNSYTRPSSVTTGRRSGTTSNYTPTYTRPSSGLRQNFNTNKPATTTPASNYYRRPASNSSTIPVAPQSNQNSNTYRRPASTGSVGTSNSGTSNSGSSNSGTTRRRR
jgi:RhoGEF, Guanine nucleotide exchange factor for Rho/Rac/Cdc42-like GTPases